MQITKIFHTETGHRLTNYEGACSHFHGHSYKWEVTITSEVLDKTGFILDYKDLKGVLEKTIKNLDHAFLLHDEDPIFESNHDIRLLLQATNGEKANLHILPFNPTTENILNWAAVKIQKQLPSNITLVRIKLHETESSFAEWTKPIIRSENEYEGTI